MSELKADTSGDTSIMKTEEEPLLPCTAPGPQLPESAVLYASVADWNSKKVLDGCSYVADHRVNDGSTHKSVQKALEAICEHLEAPGGPQVVKLTSHPAEIAFQSYEAGFAVIVAYTNKFPSSRALQFLETTREAFAAGNYTLTESAPLPTFEGALRKKGAGLLDAWKSRYFVLKDNRLRWYKGEGDYYGNDEEKGSIDLEDLEEPYCTISTNYLTLHSKGRSYQLWSESSIEVKRWYDNIDLSRHDMKERNTVKHACKFLATLEGNAKMFTFDPPKTKADEVALKLEEMSNQLADNMEASLSRHDVVRLDMAHTEHLAEETAMFHSNATNIKETVECELLRTQLWSISAMVLLLSAIGVIIYFLVK